MSITSVSSTSSNTSALLKKLEAEGLSSDKATLVTKDLAAAEKAGASSVGGDTDSASVRAALDARIDADVAAGKLSSQDAATVKKALDDVDTQASGSGITSQSATSAPAAAPAGGGAGAGGAGGGGGGGGGGGSGKTELSETITVSGSTKTTTITYTDGSTATTTATATAADQLKYAKTSDAGDADATASAYLSTIAPGSLIDQTA